MKKLLIYLFVLTGCATVTNSSVDGIYTCSYQNEFYTIHDTLVLQTITENVYRIKRRTGYNQKMKNETWTLRFDTEKKILIERKKGKTVFVINGELMLGNRTYKKMKQ